MAEITRTYNFTAHTLAEAAKVDAEIENIVDVFNNHDSGSSSWTLIKTSGDITNTGAAKGLVLTTPDGTKTYRISIDNNGVLTTEQL